MKTFQTYLLCNTVPLNSSETKHSILLKQTRGFWFPGFVYGPISHVPRKELWDSPPLTSRLTELTMAPHAVPSSPGIEGSTMVPFFLCR